MFWGIPQNKVTIFQDFAKDAVEQRSAFKPPKKLAKKQGLNYFIRFPAQYHVEVGEEVHLVQKLQDTERFFNSLQCLEYLFCFIPSLLPSCYVCPICTDEVIQLLLLTYLLI